MPMIPFSDWKNARTPGGRKLATVAGRPMPRLTRSPARSSRATRRAMISLSFMSAIPFDHMVHQDVRRDHLVRRDDADRHDLVHFGNHLGAGHCH